MTMRDEALAYAAMGWSVLPLQPKDKIPHTRHGVKDADSDVDTISGWWSEHPDDNIGIATGTPSRGLFVIDIDIDETRGEDGLETLIEWQREHGELPETACVTTGRGGRHLYYYGDPVGNSVNQEMGIDIRGEGGFVVAPPSVHPNGNRYEWDLDPEDTPIAKADENVYAFVKHVRPKTSEKKKQHDPNKKIGKGKRNDALFREGAGLMSQEISDKTIVTALNDMNADRCDPPLPQREVDRIIESVLALPKGHSAEWYEERKNRVLGDQDGEVRVMAPLVYGKSGQPASTVENAKRIVESDGALAGRFFYDEMAHQRKLMCPVPWDASEGARPVRDEDYIELTVYAEQQYGYTSKEKLIDAAMAVSRANSRNLLVEWLDALEWDGEPRADGLLVDFLGCEPSDYTVCVTRLLMDGLLARAYEPGCKFDYMVVLHGQQGLGKSTFLRDLAPWPELFLDGLPTVRGEDAVQALRGKWIVEVAELLALKKASDAEAVKEFVTKRADSIRPKYARDTEDRDRMCVMVGTTNRSEFLNDPTGNRRFVVVECGAVEPRLSVFDPGTHEYMVQAWAEAVQRYKASGAMLTLPAAAEWHAESVRMLHSEDDPRVGLIAGYLETLPSDARVCSSELIQNALDLRPDDVTNNRQLAGDVREIMAHIDGWVPYVGPGGGVKARCGRFGVQRCYVRADMT